MLDCWKANGLDVEAQLNAGVVTAALSLASLGDTFGGQKCDVDIGFVHFSPEEGEVQVLPTFYFIFFLTLKVHWTDRAGTSRWGI